MQDDIKGLLDDIGWRILEELQENARISFAELGRRVGLSTPAVIERVRRLEETQIILGYRTVVNLQLTGYPMIAILRISVVGDYLLKVSAVARELSEVLECHRVTGTDSFIIKLAVSSVEHLEWVIDKFTPYVATTTSLVLSSPVTNSIVRRPSPRDGGPATP
jgi:Lrp/AsnC family leucine-responsive transcriptional regulator